MARLAPPVANAPITVCTERTGRQSTPASATSAPVHHPRLFGGEAIRGIGVILYSGRGADPSRPTVRSGPGGWRSG